MEGLGGTATRNQLSFVLPHHERRQNQLHFFIVSDEKSAYFFTDEIYYQYIMRVVFADRFISKRLPTGLRVMLADRSTEHLVVPIPT